MLSKKKNRKLNENQPHLKSRQFTKYVSQNLPNYLDGPNKNFNAYNDHHE